MRSRQNDTWFIFSFISCSHHFFRFSSTSYKINSVSMHSFQLSIMTSHHIVLLIWNIRQNLDLKQYLHYASLSATSTSHLFLISFYWYDKEIACYLFLWLKVWVWPHLNRIFLCFPTPRLRPLVLELFIPHHTFLIPLHSVFGDQKILQRMI